MASTFTLNNGIELIATGEKSGTWGEVTNQNFDIIDVALDGQISIELASVGSSGSPNTVNISEGLGASDGNNRMFIFTDGASFGGDAYVQLTPNDAEKIVYVRNNFSSSSPHSIILFQGNYNSSNTYVVPRGKTAVVYFNGAGLGAVAANIFDNAHFDGLNIVGNAAVGGNLTVTGDVVAGDDVSLQSDGAVLNFGADDDVSLTHVADTAIRLNSDKALQFRDAGISIASSADGQLDIDADTEVEITTTTLDIDATTTNVSGTLAASSITEGGTALASKYLGINANANSASEWQTARTLTLGGDLSGSIAIDGSQDVTLSATVDINSIALGTDTTGNYVKTLTTTSPITGSVSSEGADATIALANGYGDTKNPYGSKSINLVLASPGSGSSNVPTFRSLVAADIPSLAISKVTGLQNALDDKLDGSGGNATSASKWASPITLTLGTDLTGNVSFDGQTGVTLNASVVNNSHTHTISNVTGLQDALNLKLDSSSNAVSASKWQTARTITLGGDLSGSVSIDGQSNVTLNASVANNAVALGTNTTGNYVKSMGIGVGFSLSNSAGLEGAENIISLVTGYGDSVNPYSSKGQGYVLAAPSGASGSPSFRPLAASDLPATDNPVTSQDFKNSGNFKSYNFTNFSAWGSTTDTRRATYSGWISVWKDRYVILGFMNTHDTNNDAYFKVFDLETETMHTINTYSGSTVYLERPYVLQNLDGSPCSTDENNFFIVSGHYYLNASRKKMGKVTATDSNPNNWTITYYGDSPYTTHTRHPSSNQYYPNETYNNYRGYTISPNAVVKGNNIYCVAYYQYYLNKNIGVLLKFDTSTNTLTQTDILSLIEGAGWAVPYQAYNLDFYGDDRDPDRYIAFTLSDSTKIRGAAVYDITDNHIETSVQYNTLRGASAWSNQGVGGPILPNGDVIICPSNSATSATDATVGIYNLNPRSAGMLEIDLKQGHGDDHDWTTSAFMYPRYFCDSKTFDVGIYDYTSTNSAPHIFDTSSLSAKQFSRGNIGAHTSNVTTFGSGDAFITRICPKPLADGRRIAFQYRYDASYSTFNNARVRYSDKILTVFKPER